ncbi:MAG: hypothetical protein MI866_11290 [Bacteroidales bacterium]|nr:hypothetical protein [Bacteroidales bacterium]
MKQYIYILGFLLLLSACEKEAPLSPSGLDDTPFLSEQIDMSKPLVAQWYNDYGIKICYDFNIDADFKFVMQQRLVANAWKLDTFKLFSADRIDYGLQMMDSLVLRYFIEPQAMFNGEKVEPYHNFIKDYFPKHLFIADSLATNFEDRSTPPGTIIGEPDNREAYQTYYSFRFNGFEPAFAFNYDRLNGLDSEAVEGILKYRNSMLYCFISILLTDKKAIDLLPVELFEPVEEYYNRSLDPMVEDGDAPVWDQYGMNMEYYMFIEPEWYINLGFVLTNSSPNRTGIYGNTTVFKTNMRLSNDLVFPGRERDIRNLLHLLIYETNAENLETYYTGQIIVERVRLFIKELYKMGIDVYEINPAARHFFTYDFDWE